MESKIKVVAIYAPADERFWQALNVFISGMQHEGLLNITLYDPGKLSSGIDREKSLTQEINEAHIVLLLLSSNLLITDVYRSISSQLLQRYEHDHTRILPILLSPVLWKETLWGKLAALPNDEKPVTQWRNRDAAYLNIVKGIQSAAKELQHLPAIQEERQHLPMPLRYTLLQTLAAHLGPVSSVAFSPDGLLLVSDSWDGTLIVWNMQNGREDWRMGHVLMGHTSLVYSLAFSPDGNVLASAGADQTIRLWEISTGRTIRVIQAHTAAISSVSFSPDGRQLVSGSDDHTAAIWDVATGKMLHRLHHGQAVLSVAWFPEGRYIVSGGADHIMKTWDTSSSKLLMSFSDHMDSIHPIAISSGDVSIWGMSIRGTYIASGSADHTVKLQRRRDVSDSSPLLTTFRKHHGVVSSVAFRVGLGLNGGILASGSHDKTIKLWDVSSDSDEELETLVGHTEAVLSVAIHPNLPLLASGSFDKTVKLWVIQDLKLTRFFVGSFA